MPPNCGSLKVEPPWPAPQAARGMPTHGFLGVYTLDRQSEEWKPLHSISLMSQGRNAPLMIYGADGDKFLIQSGGSRFTWIRP